MKIREIHFVYNPPRRLTIFVTVIVVALILGALK